jgi:hypothetical protein
LIGGVSAPGESYRFPADVVSRHRLVLVDDTASVY